MYTTRPLSVLRKSPELLDLRPTEGPNSGYLVILDEECESTKFFGLIKDRKLRDLPFPQNKDLTVEYSVGVGKDSRTECDEVAFIPVIGEPLASNRYYVIRRKGRHKGKAIASSSEADMGTFCCCTYINDAKPRPLNLSDTSQQVEIIQKKHRGYTAISTASDGFPPEFLRRKYWTLHMKTPRRYHLDHAPGLDPDLRASLPELGRASPMVVGKWYVPFMFVKEQNVELKEQMKRSMFYEMTLEQRWDKIFERENGNMDLSCSVMDVDVVVDKEEAFVGGRKVVCDWGRIGDEVTWFRSDKGEDTSSLLGLSVLVAERMKWEQERVGVSVSGDQKSVRVKRSEKFEGKSGKWFKFECYILVERFVLKRMDESVLLVHDFKHTNQIRCKWD